ncbi:type IV secretory system conjugative DNA transfer family protein [Pseudobutyrivibrio sp.]|uniref:type IV secretory system conjugative DNA transfer family protein n=1 Tax=Pseudobutyrivibrio sp. TaxID=2014367 RepID=UPI00386DB463
MGDLYKKSTKERFKRLFTHNEDLKKEYRIYSLSEMSCSEDENDFVNNPWENGYGGVPISFAGSAANPLNRVYIDHTDAHTLVIGPTGSKKSRLIAMPLVRILGNKRANESMIISDPKSEIYKRTASYLEKQGYTIHVINFRSPEYGDRWNPLHIPYKFYCEGNIDRAYEFVNDISENLIRNSRLDQSDPFWDYSAGSLFFGLVLLLFKYCKEHKKNTDYIHIGNVVRLRNELFSTNIKRKTELWEYAKKDSIIESAMVGTVETANDTRAGILSVFDQKMRMFSIQPNLLSMLSENTAHIDDLIQSPTAFYLILPDEKTGYHGLAALFIKQSYEYLIYSAQQGEGYNFDDGKLNRRLNYVLDEFSSLPAISDFPEMITAARSRNIRFTLIIQSKNQLVQRYKEEAETIQTNCNNWIFLTSRELPMLKEISELCGNVSTDSGFVPLLPVSALQRLNKSEGEALVLTNRKKPLITFLPDITHYDHDNYTIRTLEYRPLKESLLLSIESFTSPKAQTTDDFLENVDLDKLIKDIDAKIAELDEEEKRSSKKNDFRESTPTHSEDSKSKISDNSELKTKE